MQFLLPRSLALLLTLVAGPLAAQTEPLLPNSVPVQGGCLGYEYASNAWPLTSTLTPLTTAPGQGFGYTVAVEDDRIVVGAPGDAQAAGAVYVFDLVSGSWTQTARLTTATPVAYAFLGLSIDFDRTTVVVGALGDLNGSPLPGSAHVFQHDGTT